MSPRLNERGSFEARDGRDLSDLADASPRLNERGSFEASSRR